MSLTLKTKFIILAISCSLIVFFSFPLIFSKIKNVIETNQTQNTENILYTINREIINELDSYKNEIAVLAQISLLDNLALNSYKLQQTKNDDDDKQNLLDKYNSNRHELENIFYTYVKEHSDYFQLRYIDKSGMEIVRVDRNDKNAKTQILNNYELSDKSDRYYFQEALKLANKKIYVSALDLNIENGEIQVPHIPTIRFATPVYSEENTIEGVIVLNIFADKILDLVKMASFTNTALIDQDGYFIYNSINKEMEWSRYLDTGYILDDYVNNINYFISNFRQKNFLTDINDIEHNKNHHHFFYKVNFDDIYPENFWIIVTNTNNNEFYNNYEIIKNNIFSYLTFFIILAVAIFTFFMILFTKPLKYLKTAINNLNIGNYDFSIPVIGDDELGQISKKINSLVKNFRKKDKEKYDFIASASHQLRTPSSTVRMYLNLLEEEILKDSKQFKYKEYWQEISRGNRTVVTILDDMLKYIEIGESYFASELKNINIFETVNMVIAKYQETIDNKKLKISIKLPKKLAVRAEEDRFKELMLNLIANAIDYSNDEGKILIKATRTKDNDFIKFEIKDNGIGIPKEEHINIFSKFYRAKNAYSKKSVGSGLGLTIAKKIVEGHGGKLWFTSDKDKGTSMFFTIFNH